MFKLNKTDDTVTDISDGRGLPGGLVQDAAGNLYGPTAGSGGFDQAGGPKRFGGSRRAEPFSDR